MLQQGQIFDSKYEILKVIGSGGMGTVYLAQNIKLGTFWAIKEINKSNGSNVDLLAEPNMLKKVNHHALPRIFDILEDKNYIYIIEDYIEGTPLEKELAKQGNFSEKQVIEWAKQICDALKYLHSLKPNPIIYRDMKPSNLIISNNEKIKIVDFGIAREFKKESTVDTTYIGTRGYAAPEQYGTSQSDARTDIYSLGITLYHMLTGKSPNEPPYEIKPVRELNQKLSRGIEYIISKCTRQDPSQRYQSVDKLLKDLENAHKFDYEYKRRVLKKDLAVGAFITVLIMFLVLTFQGWKQIGKEKIDEYNKYITDSIELRELGNYDDAMKILKVAIDKMPYNPQAYKEMAIVYFKQKEYDKVIEYVDQIFLEHVNDFENSEEIRAELDYIVGTSYFEKKEYENAAECLKNAVLIDPFNTEYKRDLAVCLAKSGRIEEASVLLNEAKNIGIDDDSLTYVNGEISFSKGNYKEAASFLLRAIEQTKDEDIKKRSFLALAENYDKAGNNIAESVDLCIGILEKASDELEEKNNIVIIEMLGNAYSKKAGLMNGKEKSKYLLLSAQQFEELLSIGYKRPYIMRNIAILYQQIGELNKSEMVLNEMLKAYPEEYSAYMQLAFLYADMENRKNNEIRNYDKTLKNYELAKKYYSQATSKGIDDPQMKALEALVNELRDKNWIK